MKKLLIASLMAIFLSGFSANANFSSNFSSFINIANITQDEDQMMVQEEPVVESASFTQEIKKRFIEGGPSFMGIVMLCLILGLAISIERIIFLNLATTNTKKLTESVEAALSSGGVNAAKDLCRDTKLSLIHI